MLFQTQRLIVRKFKSTDLPYLIDMFSDEEVMRFLGSHRALTAEESREWLENILQKQEVELTRFAVALKESDELIGAAGLQKESGIWDFGYYFRRSFWGKGYASEACVTILNYVENELQIRNYQIFIADENRNSIRVMERLGMQPVKSLIKAGEQGHRYQRVD